MPLFVESGGAIFALLVSDMLSLASNWVKWFATGVVVSFWPADSAFAGREQS